MADGPKQTAGRRPDRPNGRAQEAAEQPKEDIRVADKAITVRGREEPLLDAGTVVRVDEEDSKGAIVTFHVAGTVATQAEGLVSGRPVARSLRLTKAQTKRLKATTQRRLDDGN